MNEKQRKELTNNQMSNLKQQVNILCNIYTFSKLSNNVKIKS